MKKPQEFYIFREEFSNRALTRSPGEKWPDDVNCEPSDKWTLVREVVPGQDAAKQVDWEKIWIYLCRVGINLDPLDFKSIEKLVDLALKGEL